jgi:AcrR family transcriptional regulator
VTADEKWAMRIGVAKAKTRARRPYDSSSRQAAAEQAQQRLLDVARRAFLKAGIDAVTIADIAEQAEVSVSSVYALFESKAGILRALMSRAIFNADYERVSARLRALTDPYQALRLTAAVARAIYEGEEKELALLRGATAFSPGLAKLDAEFEDRRYQLQSARIELLFEQKQQRPGLSFERARDVMWMLTSRDCYRMLVVDKQWPPEEYESWLAELLVRELTKSGASGTLA